MTNANVTSTDEYSLVNVRVGLESDDWSIEGYVTNLMEEEGYTNLQLFPDLSGQSGGLNRMILAGLMPQRSIGIRTSFEF